MKRPVVRLKPGKDRSHFERHPWVFAGSIHRVEGNPETGAEVRVESSAGELIGHGLFNWSSKIRVRIYRWNEQPLDADFWKQQLRRAIDLRLQMFCIESPERRACRLLFSEGDGLSGLTVDRYGDWLLTQWTSAALWTHRDLIAQHLIELLQPAGIWARTEQGLADLEGMTANDSLLWGAAPPPTIELTENGVHFGVNVLVGQKTGYYFDQRDNRRAIAKYTVGANVLDVCSYTGSIGLNALVLGNAAKVLAVDSSRPALELATANAARNGVLDRYETEVSDAYDKLESLVQSNQLYDVVILDPPKMARTQAGLRKAEQGYVRLNRLGMQVVRPGGFLVTCSCSGLLNADSFAHILTTAALQTGRELQFVEQRGQAPDHPISAHCPETSYLKCTICRVN